MHHIASTTLAGFLLLTSILHFVVPERVQTLVPLWWPYPRLTVYLSGLLEAVLATGLLLADFREVAAWTAAALLLAYAAVHAEAFRSSSAASGWFDSRPFITVRVLANLGYAAWAGLVAIGTMS